MCRTLGEPGRRIHGEKQFYEEHRAWLAQSGLSLWIHRSEGFEAPRGSHRGPAPAGIRQHRDGAHLRCVDRHDCNSEEPRGAPASEGSMMTTDKKNEGADDIRLMLAYLCVATEAEASLERSVQILDRFNLTDAEIARVCGSAV